MTPFHRQAYPADWEQISLYVRFIRAAGACEQCGAWNGYPNPETAARVMLTVSHTDHDVTHNDLGNLQALCQACHLRHDAQLHAQHARQTRTRRQIHAGQLTLI